MRLGDVMTSFEDDGLIQVARISESIQHPLIYVF